MSRPRVIIEVVDGVVQNVRADTEMDVLVIDHDAIQDGGAPTELELPKEDIDFEAIREEVLEEEEE